MYCNKCGNPIPNGSISCAVCDQPLQTACDRPESSTSSEALSIIQPMPSASARSPRNLFFEQFRIAWRRLAASPLALALVITQTVSVVLFFIELRITFQELLSEVAFLSLLSSANGDPLAFLETAFTVILLLCSTPGVLTAIGLWMLYADAHDLSARPLHTAGLTLIKCVTIGLIAVFCIAMLVVFITVFSAKDELASIGTLMADTILGDLTDRVFNAIILTLLIVSIAAGLLFYCILLLIDTVWGCAKHSVPDMNYATGLAIAEFVIGGLSVIGMLYTQITDRKSVV